jgi:hypothetical protein
VRKRKSKNIKKKIKAMKIYNSEYQKEPYPRNTVRVK